MTCPYVHRLGAFALDVDDAERATTTAHLESCARCRAELADLAEVTALLSCVRDTGLPAEMEPRETADLLLDRVLAAVATERDGGGTTRRRLALAAAALVVVGSAAGAAVALRNPSATVRPPAVTAHGSPPPARWTTTAPPPVLLAAGSSRFGVTATTTARARPWGTRIEMALRGLPSGASCRLVARAADGRTESVAAWRVSYGNAMTVDAMTSISASDLADLQVIDQHDRRLITVAATPREGTPR